MEDEENHCFDINDIKKKFFVLKTKQNVQLGSRESHKRDIFYEILGKMFDEMLRSSQHVTK